MVFTAGRGRATQVRMGPSCFAANAMLGGNSPDCPVLKIIISNLCPVSFPTVRSHSSSSSSSSLLAQAFGILSDLKYNSFT